MAKVKFTDSAGREAWLDEATNMVYTEGGTNPTYYDKAGWDRRQLDKYGPPEKEGGDTSTNYAATQAKMLFDLAQDKIKEQTKFLSEYDEKNPFAFDEALAKESVVAEYDPYYTEMLDDFLKEINLQRETVEDDLRLNTALNEYDVGAKSREYVRARRQISQGYADKGTFFGGEREATLGEAGVEQKADLGRTEAIFENRQVGLERGLEGIDIRQSTTERDIGREKKAAIEGGVLGRREEAIKQYLYPREETYSRKFGSTGGYTVPSLLRY